MAAMATDIEHTAMSLLLIYMLICLQFDSYLLP